MLSEIVLVLYFTVGLLGTSPAHVRIINGTDAREGEIPYIVSVRYDNMHSCGGSILDERHILTAAHCVKSRILSHLTVQYGVVTITREANSPNITAIKKVQVNSNYVPGDGYRNDIAVLKLEKPMIFGLNAQPVMLAPAFNATPEHNLALLSGWGANYTYGFNMDNLQKVSITVYSDDECERIYASNHTNREYHICAGVPEGGKGQCFGDSGGPLVVNGFQVGVVSWSKKSSEILASGTRQQLTCTPKGYPGVFTKVSTQVPWIYQQMKNE